MSTRAKIIAAAGIAVVAAAFTVYAMLQFRGDDEDRPPIIVRSGSINFEGGVPNDWKPWKQHGSKKQWQPNQPKGAPVVSYSVAVAGSTGPSAPSSPCPSLAMLASKVVVEYTTTAGVKSQVVISIDTTGSKAEPLVDAPADLTQVPGNGSTPDDIVYDPGAGWISNVTISDAAGAQQLCGFERPASGPGSAKITIKPNR